MKKVVFYSWQTDLANGTNRTFIENALKAAAKEIKDDAIDIEPVIDRDTLGVAGAPDIASTIFGKIAAADIFVADISLVLKGKKRSSPNPNVLIELGYAFRALDSEQIVLVFNEASGSREKLPFDLKTRRLLIYKAAEGDADRSNARTNLTKDFKAALLLGIEHTKPAKRNTPILEIIKSQPASRIIDLREYLTSLSEALEDMRPLMTREGGTVEALLGALPKTVDVVAEFARLSNIVAIMEDRDSAKEIFRWFGMLLQKYHPYLANGTVWNSDGDFYKFLGNELFVVFISSFVHEEKWKIIREVLMSEIRVGQTQHHFDEVNERWTSLSEYCPSILDEGKKRGNRMSLHADLLKERHENGELGKISPFREFSETDLFLYLFGENSPDGKFHREWYPQSILWLDHTPRFITAAEHFEVASKICNALGIDGIDELKSRLESSQTLEYARRISPISQDAIKKIGSKGGGKVFVSSKDSQ